MENETSKISQVNELLIKNNDFKNTIDNIKNIEINKAIEDFNKKSKHINIIILGKTGVGKSELINALKGENIAETGGFQPVTKKTTWYEIGSLRLCDNLGYEISKKNSLDAVLGNIKKLIEDAKNNKNPDEFIHCIWYCITGTRFEPDEELAVRKLLESYEDKCMPLIIVYLRAISKQ